MTAKKYFFEKEEEAPPLNDIENWAWNVESYKKCVWSDRFDRIKCRNRADSLFLVGVVDRNLFGGKKSRGYRKLSWSKINTFTVSAVFQLTAFCFCASEKEERIRSNLSREALYGNIPVRIFPNYSRGSGIFLNKRGLGIFSFAQANSRENISFLPFSVWCSFFY